MDDCNQKTVQNFGIFLLLNIYFVNSFQTKHALPGPTKTGKKLKTCNTCQTQGPLVETDNKYNKNIAAQTRLIVKRTQHSQNDTSEIRFLAKHNR